MTEAFKAWFANSAIALGGAPRIVYHGTRPGNDFTEFWVSGQDGAYFTPDLNYAEAYTIDLFGDDAPGAIYPVYLSIQRPYTVSVDDGSAEWRAFVERGLNKAKLIEQGFDGAVLVHAPSGEIDQIIAFHPWQIKSATGNDGSYDINDNSILS